MIVGNAPGYRISTEEEETAKKTHRLRQAKLALNALPSRQYPSAILRAQTLLLQEGSMTQAEGYADLVAVEDWEGAFCESLSNVASRVYSLDEETAADLLHSRLLYHLPLYRRSVLTISDLDARIDAHEHALKLCLTRDRVFYRLRAGLLDLGGDYTVREVTVTQVYQRDGKEHRIERQEVRVTRLRQREETEKVPEPVETSKSAERIALEAIQDKAILRALHTLGKADRLFWVTYLAGSSLTESYSKVSKGAFSGRTKGQLAARLTEALAKADVTLG